MNIGGMNSIEIIKQLQEKYKEVDSNSLMAYINNLIKIEYLRYHSNEDYFNTNFEDILLENKMPDNELDYAIEQAVFITLQPLRTDINVENIEQILLSWSGYILNRDISSGNYPKDIIHYFEDDEEIDFTKMSKYQIRAIIEYNNMVSSDKKEHCTKILCKKIKRFSAKQAKMNDKNFYTNLAIINYRFLRIHPFDDGNGRVSRMLLNYMFNFRNDCIPIALDNNEINELIGIYKETSKLLYAAFMGVYLSNLEYDDEGSSYLEIEEQLIESIGRFLYLKQLNAKEQILKKKSVKQKSHKASRDIYY